jgi:predicted nucleotidyltransferase
MASLNSKQKVEELVTKYSKLVKEKIDVRHVYLYGSYVKGDYTPDSDIDVAIVGDDFSGDLVEDTLMLMKIRRKIDNRIEPRPFKTSEFNASNPLAREIMNTGVKVM